MAFAARCYDALLEVCGVVAGALIGALAVMVTADVVVRNTGLGSLPWVIEIAEYVLYVSTFLAAPWALRQGAHVRVDVFVGFLRGPAARLVDVAVNLIGLTIVLVLVVFGIAATADAARIGSLIIKELIVPEWWLLAVLPGSASLLAAEFVRRIARPAAKPVDDDAVADGL